MAESAMIQAVVGKPVEKLVEYLLDAIKKQLRYLCCYSCNVQTLDGEVGKLDLKRQGLQQRVDADKNKCRDILPNVEAWLREAVVLKTRSDEIQGDAEKVKRSCLCKWIPVLHYSLSRKALKTTNDSIQLRNIEFDEISTRRIPVDIPPVPNTSIVVFESRVSIENKIMDALKNPGAYSIGILGMGGVGKTVMAKKIEEIVRENESFKRVITIVVSQKPDIRKIQKQIAGALSLSLTEAYPENWQRELHEGLKAEKGILIILDDLWDGLDFHEIGIPSQSTGSGCKLILTSRDKDALTSSEVPNESIYRLDILTKEESWRFFKDNAGITADDDSHDELVQIANKVERECTRLPLALKIVARALKGKGISCWKNAVRELEKQVPDNIPGVIKDVYESLRFSINALDGKEQKYLFFLCCLFPEDHDISIEELLGCRMGLEIFEKSENLTVARDNVETVLNILLSRSLLIEGGEKGGMFYVRMHDVIRDVGIRIATKGIGIEKHVFLIKHGLNEWPTMEDNCTCISLQFSHHRIIFPESLVFSKLEFLRLDFVGRSSLHYHVKLPNNFFDGTSGLRVFEASHIGLLPASICQLNNLRTLSLDSCKIFKPTSVLGKLINLEMLRLSHCEFEVLPKEIGGLKKLKQMKILSCRSLRRIAFGVVSELVELEELVILDSFDNWKGEEDIACLSELDALKNITTLKIKIRHPCVVPSQKPLWVEKLKKYDITISNRRYVCWKNRFQKAIQLGKEVVNPLEDWIYDMASGAEYVNVEGCNCMEFVKRLSKNFGNRSCLKGLRLSHFTGIQYLVEGQQNNAVFTALEYLRIEDSMTLQQIFKDSPPSGSFKALQRIHLDRLRGMECLSKFSVKEEFFLNLQEVDIFDCDKLSYLFSLSVVQCLMQLSCLRVMRCPSIKEIFKRGIGEATITKITLPKLREIEFLDLDSFYCLCSKINIIELPELSSLSLKNVPRMKMMEDDNNEVHQKYFISKVDNVQVRGISFDFCVLRKLTVNGIENSKCMFSASVISELANLKYLHVENCSMLEQVMGKDNENVGREIILPNLDALILKNLPKIRTFCYNAIQFPSLTLLLVLNCPLMLKFVEGLTHHNSSSRPFLDKQDDNVQVIRTSFDFCVLRELAVNGIKNIKCIFSASVINELPNLKNLNVKNCSMLEEVMEKDNEKVGREIIFPNLNSLELMNLPNTHTFCYNAIQFLSLEWLSIDRCPLMLKFVDELTDDISNSRSFLDKQVKCPKLKSLNLDGLNISGVFSTLFFKSLTVLEGLHLKNCEELEHMITKEEGQIVTNMEEEILKRIPLKRFCLKNLPKLCGSVFHIKHSLEFPSLEEIRIEDCPMLEKFSLGSLHLPKLKSVSGLLNAEFATNFFFHKEMSFRKIHSKNNCFIISAKDISFDCNNYHLENGLRFLALDSSESFVDVVSIALNYGVREIVGEFKKEKIRKGIEYKVILMIKLLNEPVCKNSIQIELKVLEGSKHEESKLQHMVILKNHPKDTWSEISIGKFVGESLQSEQLKFSLSQSRSRPWNRAVIWIKGIRIVEA